MSDKQFTFLQMHFHDGIQLGPDRISTGGSDEDAEASADPDSTAGGESAPTPAAESDSSGPSLLVPALGFGALATAVAVAVKKLLAGTDTEGLDALDDVDEPEDSVPIEITTREEESGGYAGLVAGVVGLLLVLAVAAKKLLSGGEEIGVEE